MPSQRHPLSPYLNQGISKIARTTEQFEDAKTPSAERAAILSEAIDNAMLLIQTACERAITLDDQIIATVLHIRNMQETATVEAIDELEFWQSYRTLSEQLYPITIHSIKATSDSTTGSDKRLNRWFLRRPMSLSQKCVANYKLLSAITLITLIALQIYWYIGFALIADINTQNKNILLLSDKLASFQSASSQAEDFDDRSDSYSKNYQYNRLLKQLNEHKIWKEAAANHLENWNDVWSSLDLLTHQPWQDTNFANLKVETQRRIQFVSAENALQAISEYFLPILYGLIGACFYILRQLPKEIENQTFSKNSYINYSLRVTQGPLAGILISYFTNPTKADTTAATDNVQQLLAIDPGASSLSPLALAFLAGYSVEFIFRFLDRFLSLSLASDDSHSQKIILNSRDKNKKSLKENNNPE